VGLADPTALPLAVAAFQGSQLIGKPECDVLLAQATVHLGKSFLTSHTARIRTRKFCLIFRACNLKCPLNEIILKPIFVYKSVANQETVLWCRIYRYR
jgi:hypothetical protein